MPIEKTVRAAQVFKRARPSTAGISHATVLNVPCSNANLLQRIAEMAGVDQVILRAPIAAGNKQENWMWSFCRGQTHVNKLVFVLAVWNAQVRIRRLLGENGFALHCGEV